MKENFLEGAFCSSRDIWCYVLTVNMKTMNKCLSNAERKNLTKSDVVIWREGCYRYPHHEHMQWTGHPLVLLEKPGSEMTANKVSEKTEFRNGPAIAKTGDKHCLHLNTKPRWDKQEASNCRKEYKSYKY